MKTFDWFCPKCGNRVGMGVAVSQPPVCFNHIGNKPVEMKKENEQQRKPNPRVD